MSFPEKSHLIDTALEQQLGLIFAKLKCPVELLCIAGTEEKSAEMVVFLKHLVSLCPLLSVRILSPGEDAQLDRTLDASLLPATGVGGTDSRMIFHGVPGGKEITAFAAAILNAGGGAKELSWLSRHEIDKLHMPLTLQLFVSLSCQHCAQLVINAQRIAWENPNVTAHMIDAGLYPALTESLGLNRVPLTVVNGGRQYPGGKTMLELTALLRKSQS